jgi:lysophospholipase L1-like esterase
MKKIVPVIMIAAAIAIMSFNVHNMKKKIIFFGDSITQAGVEPKGYISVLRNDLAKQGITDLELVGAGIGGNKVYDLYLRLEDDVLSKSPSVVVIFVGVNDVWHKKSFGTGTDPDKFEKFYRAIIRKIRASGSKVVVCTPAVVGEKNDFSNELDGDLNRYSNIIRAIAVSENIPLADFRRSFIEYEKANNPGNVEKGILTTDGVHLNDKGNEFLAQQVWAVLKELK